MAVLSTLLESSIPYNCYETMHTWSPGCYEAALSLGYSVLIESVKIYASLFLISQIFQRKFSLEDFWNTLQSICASSCFLSFQGLAFFFLSCMMRKSMGKFYMFHCIHIPALAASFLAILIERKSRRKQLALYAANIATQILFRMATSRGLIKPIKNGEVLLFSTTMALLLYIVRRHGFSRDIVSLGIKYVLGKEEAKHTTKAATGASDSIKNLPSSDSLLTLGSSVELPSVKPDILLRFVGDTKHASCPHSLSCIRYSLEGFLRPFIIGYLASSGIRCLSMGRKLFSNPSLLQSLLTERRSLNFAIFLGGFGGTFRTVNCLLRWLFNKDQALYALPAAFLGGLFMKFFPSSSLALYLAWKLIEVSYSLGIKEGMLPNVKGSMLIMYAASGACFFHAIMLEPHNLPSSNLKFMTRMSQNKLGEINRHALDIFGTHASKLYSDFWPELDWRYTSKAFRESVLL